MTLYEFPNKTFTNRKPSFSCEQFFCWHKKEAKWKTGLFYIYHKPSRALMKTVQNAEEAHDWCISHKDIYVDIEEHKIVKQIVEKKSKEEPQPKVAFPSLDEMQSIHNNIIKQTKGKQNGMV